MLQLLIDEYFVKKEAMDRNAYIVRIFIRNKYYRVLEIILLNSNACTVCN